MKTSSIQKMGLAVYLLCAWLISTSAIAQTPARRVSLRERNPEFFKTEEARRIGDQIIAYQRCTGGWPKNIDMTRDMSREELDAVIKEKNRRNDSTIDNNASTSQMTFLARLYRATKRYMLPRCLPCRRRIPAQRPVREWRVAPVLARETGIPVPHHIQRRCHGQYTHVAAQHHERTRTLRQGAHRPSHEKTHQKGF